MGHIDPSDAHSSVYVEFRDRALRHPTREFVVHRSARLTWSETLDLVDQCAAALTQAGVRTGDRVGLLSPTRPETGIVLLACAKLGAIYLGLGTRLQRGDMDYVCSDARPSLLLAMPDPDLGDRTGDLVAAAEQLGLAHPLVLSYTSDGTLSPEFLSFLASATSASEEATGVDQFAPVTIVYTSGTTGSPKGVVLSHRSLLNYRNLVARNPVKAPRLLSSMPIDHIGYIGNELTTAILTDGTMVQLPRFDAHEALETIQRERVTAWMGAIPTMLNRLVALDEFAAADLSSLELVWWAGQLPERTALTIAQHADQVGASYGMSEMCCITLTDPGIEPIAAMSTVGRPLDDVEVRIQPVPGDERDGEIMLRRTGMMNEYWGKPEATTEAIDKDGWFHTGDLGHVAEDGSLVITGRLKLLIRSGGYNVSPFEIESVLESHPDIAMAVIVGVPDAEYGEAAHAAWMPIVGAEISEADLRAFLRQRLAGFKVPKGFHRFDQLPLLANGKADRLGIRQRLRDAVIENLKESADVR